MKILQINNVYNKGSTGKIVNDIHSELEKHSDIQSIVCYGRGKGCHDKNIYKTSFEILAKFNALKSRLTGLQYNGSLLSTYNLKRIIMKERPDIVHLHCLNGYFVNIYKLLGFLKKNKIKTVLTLHAEFMHTGSCGHAYECNKWLTGCGDCPQLWSATKSYWLDRTEKAWNEMYKALENFDNLEVVSVSSWLQERSEKSPILNSYPNTVIFNGIDTEGIFKSTDYSYLVRRHNLQEEKILLHVTANFSLREDDVKGGRYIIDLAEKLKHENIKILVVGKKDGEFKLPSNVILINHINNQKELAAYYSLADLSILTSDRETYSMVCAESLACGTPVVGFRAGGPESIAIEQFSEFVEPGNIEELKIAILKWLYFKKMTNQEISKAGSEIYSRHLMCKEYLKIYKKLYS